MHGVPDQVTDREVLSLAARARAKLDAALDECLADLTAIHQCSQSPSTIALARRQRVIDRFLNEASLVPDVQMCAIRELRKAWKQAVPGEDPACICQNIDRAERGIDWLLASADAWGTSSQLEAAE